MRKALLAFVHVVVLAAVAIGMWQLVIEPVRANRHLARIEQQTRRILDEPGLQAAPIARQNIAELRAIQRQVPRNIDVYMLLSMNAFLLQQYEATIGYLNEALEIDQRPEIYMNRAFAYVELGRIDAAVDDFARAVAFHHVHLDSVSPALQERVSKAAGLK